MANTLGTRISTLRKQRGLTQDQLAEAMGVSAQAVSKWENDLSCPDIAMLPQLADFFHVTIDELMRDKETIETVKVVPEEARKPLDQMVMKIRILSPDADTKGMDRINVNLPIPLVKMGLQMGMITSMSGKSDALNNVDFDKILQLTEQGLIGKLVEIQSSDGDLIEITVE